MTKNANMIAMINDLIILAILFSQMEIKISGDIKGYIVIVITVSDKTIATITNNTLEVLDYTWSTSELVTEQIIPEAKRLANKYSFVIRG